MPQIKINNTLLEYQENGTGEPVLLVHGSVNDIRTWKYQTEKLSKHFRTIYYSRRYHYPNQQIADNQVYTMDQQLKDLEELIISLDSSPVQIIGHSYGGFLALLLAIKNPDLIRSMVLIEPPVVSLFISNQPTPLEILKLLFTNPGTAVSLIKFGIKGVTPATKSMKENKQQDGLRIFGEAIFGKDQFDKLPPGKKDELYDNISNAKAELLGPGFLPLKEEEIKKIRTPTLFVSGKKSIKLFHHLTDQLVKLIPGSRQVVIKDATHLVHEDNPEQFNKTVISFLMKQKQLTKK